ncbi:hypothetical protein BGX24_004130, partial [Mortierella sp. AD032]
MAQKYGQWKDDLDFVVGQEMYWGTVAPRLPDRGLGSRPSEENGVGQRREGTRCTPCILQGLKCSGDKPICIQCRSKSRIASSTGESLAMCSYPINRAFVPESKRQIIRRRLRGELFESNLAAAVEYLDSRLDGGEEAAQSRDDGSWRIGVKGERVSDEEAESMVPVRERTNWLARALLDEGPESRTSDKTQTGTESDTVGKAQDGVVEPGLPLKHKRRSSTQGTQQSRRRVVEELIRSPAMKGVRSGRRSTIPTAHVKMMKVMKNASQTLKATGTWTVAPGMSMQGQDLESASIASDTDESGENGENDDSDDSGMKAKTPTIPKYRKQIANTFRPWIARKGEKVIPSACDLPETTFLQALHYYASYYYTHANPSPDMFEAMDLTSHIALGMIIQEIISDFAFKLGKESQLEDIQVKVDKLVAAQHGNKWDENFVEYLKSLTADRSLSRSRKRLLSGSDEGSAESADDAGSDIDMEEDGDEVLSHGFRSWDELEGLRRSTTSFGVDTMKELVNRTSFDFNFNEGDASEVDDSDYGDLQETHLDQHETTRHLSALALDMDPDSWSPYGSGIDRTIAESSSRSTQPMATSFKSTVPRNEPAFDVDSDAGDDLDQVSDESGLESMDLDGDEKKDRLGQDDDEDEDDDMPQVDISQSVLSQLSNNRFGSQFTFGLSDSTDESEDEDKDSDVDVDDLSGRTLVQSQVLLDENDESSEAEAEAESESSESDSEPVVKSKQEKEKEEENDESENGSEKESYAEKEKKKESYVEKATKKKDDSEEEESAVEENMDMEMDNGTQDEEDEEDHSPSVLTQVSMTRFGSAFTSNQDDSSSEDDSGFNIASGRFLAQSQVVLSDSTDSSESQEDSSASESEQEKEVEGAEAEDSVTAENKNDNAPSKESHAQDKEEEEGEELSDVQRKGRADTIELKGTLEESDLEMEGIEETLATQDQSIAGSSKTSKEGDKAGQDDGPSDEGHDELSQPMVTTVGATRFGSQFTASFNASDDDDESEDDGEGYSNTQSQ